jgi:hypothetical protein
MWVRKANQLGERSLCPREATLEGNQNWTDALSHSLVLHCFDIATDSGQIKHNGSSPIGTKKYKLIHFFIKNPAKFTSFTLFTFRRHSDGR